MGNDLDTHRTLTFQGGTDLVNRGAVDAQPTRVVKRVARVLALDIATNTGVAIGMSDEMPRVYAMRMRGKNEDMKVAWRNMGCALRDLFVFERPDLIVLEAPVPAAGQRSSDASSLAFGLIGATESIAGVYGIPTVWGNNKTVAVHFVGKGNLPREDKKRAFLARAKQLRYIRQDCTNDDMADAAGLWDWAVAKYCGAVPSELTLFGGR